MLKQLVGTVLRYVPVNPLIYIMKSEPILWAAGLLVSMARGDRFFEIEDCRETDTNLYVDIQELYSMADAIEHHRKSPGSKMALDHQAASSLSA